MCRIHSEYNYEKVLFQILTLPTDVTDLNNVQIPELDDDAVSHIKTLQNTLMAMIDYHNKNT